MIIVGLTGSIGMGKSTTAKMFEDEGCGLFDADAAVHDLYDVGGAAVPIIRSVFPDAIKNGAVDRGILAKHLQTDPLHIQVLESFIHPLVGAARATAIAHADNLGKDVFVVDVPLLFETGRHDEVDVIVVVTAHPDVQRERVLSRPGMNPEKYAFILGRQVPDQSKREKADYVIFTDEGLDSARRQVKQVLSDLRTKSDK